MSSTFALYTDLPCGEGSCRRPAKFLRGDWQERYAFIASGESKFEAAVRWYKHGLVCGIHAGAVKRSAKGRWGSPAPEFYEVDLGHAEAKAVLKERADEYKARQERIGANNAENQLTLEARYAESWVIRSTETEATVIENEHVTSYDGKFRKGWKVKSGSDRSWADGVGVIVEQEGTYPAIVSVHSSAIMTPAQARKLATALLTAAALADERDILNGPE